MWGRGRPQKKALQSPALTNSLGTPTPDSPCPTWGSRVPCWFLHQIFYLWGEMRPPPQNTEGKGRKGGAVGGCQETQ